MQNKTTSPRKKTEWLSHGLGRLLFSESIGMRIFRILVMFLIIGGWGIGGMLIFDVDWKGFSIINVLRYVLAPFAAIVGAFLLGVRYLQDVYELPSYRSTFKYLFASMFDGPPHNILLLSGLLLPSLNISNGKADVEDGEVDLLQRIGGSGWLSVEAGNAVLLENLHGPSRVLGPGFHFVPRLQHVEEVFSLEDQRWEANPIVATTKDGIEIAVHDFQFGYRLASPYGNVVKKRTTTDPYPFSAKSVLKLAYNRSVKEDGKPMEWGKMAQFRLDGIITDLINKYSIDKFLAPIIGNPRDYPGNTDESPSQKDSQGYSRDKENPGVERDVREIILAQLNFPDLREAIKNYLGTEISWLNVGRFEINDEKIEGDIKAYRLKAWFAQLAGKAELIRAEGKAEQISQMESGRIEKTTSMLRGILQALADANLEGDEIEHLWNIVLARSAQVIEAMASLDTNDILDLKSADNAKKGVI